MLFSFTYRVRLIRIYRRTVFPPRFIGRGEALSLEIGRNRVCFESRIWNLEIWVARYLSG